MTWLSEIENEATLALEGDEAFTGGYMDDLRMVRVIRELIGYIRVLEENIGWGNARETFEERAKVSPDAKEVINESAAPRST